VTTVVDVRSTGAWSPVVLGPAVVVVAGGVADVPADADAPPVGAVGSAVTGDSPLQAASATTGATRPMTAARRRRAPEAVVGRARAAAEVFMSRTA
jgi:hypothetical protein